MKDIKVSVVSYAPVSENGNERSNAFIYGICIENISTRQINGTARIFKEIDPEEELFGNEVSILQGSGREKSEFTLNRLKKDGFHRLFMHPEDMKRLKTSE